MAFAVATAAPLTLAAAAKRSRGPPVKAVAAASSTTRGKNTSSLSLFATSSSQHHHRQIAAVRAPCGGERKTSSERLSVRCAATDGDNDDKAPEEAGGGLSSSFAEELKRRQMAQSGEGGAGEERVPQGSDKWGGGDDGLSSAPRFAKDDGARGVETEQLKRSRALQNEGLEGFPTRAGELLKLGFASFISFGPLIAVFSTLFVGTYLFLGEGRGGRMCYFTHGTCFTRSTINHTEVRSPPRTLPSSSIIASLAHKTT